MPSELESSAAGQPSPSIRVGDPKDRVKKIFADASELSAELREAFLGEQCGADTELRAAVDALLKAHDAAGSFLADPTLAHSTADTLIGQRIGRYKLLQAIGEGGFGTVYMAEQEEPVRRRVALKLIKLGMDTKAVIARFDAERQALAMMEHPNIAKVFDGGATETGRPYFVMELVRGIPVTRYCDDNRLDVRQRLALFGQVCSAVEHAHQKGVIHRDLKPANVLVTLVDSKPVPKVIDFGIAKATAVRLTERTLFTEFGQMIGTPEYMSPEQAATNAADVDTRSDIYSLGVLLYELLVGTTPFDPRELRSKAFGEMQRVIREVNPPRPSMRQSSRGEAFASAASARQIEPLALNRLLRGELDWVVMKCLEKDRTRRYRTASELAADVDRYLNNEAVGARPAGRWYLLSKTVRRHRVAFATACAVGTALLVGLAVSIAMYLRAETAKQTAETAQQATGQQLRLTEQAEVVATRRLYDARLAQAKAAHLSRRVGQRFDSLESLKEAIQIARRLNLSEDHFLDLRNAAIAALALPDLQLIQDGPRVPLGAIEADFDDAFKRYALADEKGNVTVRRVADDAEIAAFPISGVQVWPLLSRDGQFLAVGSDKGMAVWKLGERQASEALPLLPGGIAVDFSLDSQKVAVSKSDGSINVYNLVSGTRMSQITGSQGATHLAFDPRGERLAAVHGTSVEILDLETGKSVAELPQPATVESVAWHPDGAMLAVSVSDEHIHLWDVGSGKQTLVLEAERGRGVAVAFNHAGNLLASHGWGAVLRLWDLRTAKPLFRAYSTFLLLPRFSADDHRLAADSRDGKLGYWRITADTGEYQTLSRLAAIGNGIYDLPDVRFDGRLLAVTMYHGFGLWDLRSGKELGYVDLPDCNQALFEPSGALLTISSAGLLRWPIDARPEAPESLRIGPPQRLAVPGAICHIARSRDGRVIAVSQYDGARVLHADRPDEPVRLAPHDDAWYVSVSPNGRLVATGSQHQLGVKIWDAASGKFVKELPTAGGCVSFSPDGRWLAARGAGLRLWDVESGNAGPEIGGGDFAFSADGKLLAVETGFGAVRLVDPNSGHEYARLEDPNQDRASSLTFTPDAARLISANGDSRSIHVWDLRKLRAGLAEMGLDWDQPPYPPAKPEDGKPLKIEIETKQAVTSS